MYSPVILSPLLLFAGIGGAFSRRLARTLLPLVSLATIADGLIGFIFHVRGIHRKPAGWRTPIADLIMGPPVFAPPLFAISGYLGLIASMLRREDDPEWEKDPQAADQPRAPWLRLLPRWLTLEARHVEQDAREGRLQQQLAVAAAISAVFSGIESLYSHYENNFRFKVQWSPILLTPVVAATGIGAVWSRTVARTLLPLVSLLAMLDGAIGTFYHVRGMLRRPGGLKLPLYNLIYGPPVFAPLLFAASGFLGLLASLLRRAE
jgi:energy-converting hydrogenase Eha subunit A